MPTLKSKIIELVNEYWNEHDGDHFYKDELNDLILKGIVPLIQEEERARIDKEITELIHPNTNMKIERKWAMPNKWTFTIKPIRELLIEEVKSDFIDPFAGFHSVSENEYCNDINPKSPAYSHEDALLFLKGYKSNSVAGVLFDPPYSITQAKQCYEGHGMDKLDTKPTSMKYWADCKNEVARIVKPGGKVICFGWTSMGLGKGRGFEMQRILLVPHGGSKNDTIVTVEEKL